MMDDRSTDFACCRGNEEPAKYAVLLWRGFRSEFPRVSLSVYNERPCRTFAHINRDESTISRECVRGKNSCEIVNEAPNIVQMMGNLRRNAITYRI